MAEEEIVNGEVNGRSEESLVNRDQHAVGKVTELTRSIGDVENDNHELACENSEMSEKVAKLTTEIEQLRDAESKTKRKLVEMERELDKSDEEKKVLEAIATRAAELQKEVARLQHDLVNTMNEGDDATAEVKNLQKEISEKEVQLEGLEKEVENLRTVREDNDKRVRELEAKLRDLEVRELDERNKKMRSEEEMRDKIDQKEKEIAGLKTIVEGLEFKVRETKTELEIWKTEKTGVAEMLKVAEKNVASMEMEMVELQKHLEVANKVIEGFKDGVNEPVNRSIAGDGHRSSVGVYSQWPVVAAGSAGVVAAVTIAALCVLRARRK